MNDVAADETTCFVCGRTINTETGGLMAVRFVGKGTAVCSDSCEYQLRTAELPQNQPEVNP